MTNATAFLPTLTDAAIGSPITRGGVSLFPVYLPGSPVPASPVITGPGAGVEIVEQPNATVPTLRATNLSNQPVLLVEGQVVRGGQQDRVLNVSIVVPAGQSIDIPVSCVEQGRWSQGSHFDDGRSFATRRVRRAKTHSVSQSVRQRGDRYSNQSAVWATVGHEMDRLGVEHPSRSLLAIDDVARGQAERPAQHEPQRESHFDVIMRAIDELTACGPLPGQCGVVVAHGGRPVSLECFATPALLSAHWPALVRSIMLDAPEGSVSRPSATRALKFVRDAASRRADATPGVGLGTELHIRSSRLVGQAVVVDDCVLHASAFALAA
ncbi:MAG: hypothetical protein RJB61_625 [Actinomycetota bacterium]